MKKRILLFASLIAMLFVSSCSIENIDPDLSTAIVGSYKMNTYVTKSGASTPGANDNVVVSRISNSKAKVTIDYAQTSATDVVADECIIVKSGETYTLTQSFTNAEVKVIIIGSTMTYTIDYKDGTFAHISATKK